MKTILNVGKLKTQTLIQLRGWATLGVLVIHATGPYITHASKETSMVYAQIVLNQFSRFCVPLFFFISSYLYSKKKLENLKYKEHVLRRLQTIGFPYLFWAFFYLIMHVVTGAIPASDLSFPNVSKIILQGSAHGHLYFIPAIFQFYLLLPVFIIVTRKITSTSTNYSFIIFYFLAAIAFYQVRMMLLGTSAGEYIIGSNYLIVWWLPFILAGMIFQNFDNSRSGLFFLFILTILAFVVMNYEYLCSFHHHLFYYSDYLVTENSGEMASFLRPSSFIFEISMIYMLIYVIQGHGLHLRIMDILGKYSFGIYLAHPFINKVLIYCLKLLGFRHFVQIYNPWIVMFLGSVLTVISVCLLSKYKRAHWIIGYTR